MAKVSAAGMPRWIAVLIAVLLAVAGLALVLTGRDPESPAVRESVTANAADPQDGSGQRRGQISVKRWRKPKRAPVELTEAQRERIQQLESIGYLSGTQQSRVEDVVTVYDPARAQDGLNLYTSGHLPGAILVDMSGHELHRWRKSLEEIWPGEELPEKGPRRVFWRRAHLFPDGSILGVFAGAGIFKLDIDSNLLWSNLNGAHHDLEVLVDGRILVLTREANILDYLDPEEPILEDFLVTLSPDGEELARVSLVEAMWNSTYRNILQDENLGTGDIFHANTVHLLDGRHVDRAPWLAKGNVLTCLRNIDALVVLDPAQAVVVHAMTGAYRRPHDPQMLEDGSMILFDNQGAAGGHSRVVRFDPVGSKLHWFYAGEANYPLASATLGTVSVLANGNTLITESENGRAVEVTPEKEIVWEFFNPYRVGDGDEYIATLFEMVRLPADHARSWLGD